MALSARRPRSSRPVSRLTRKYQATIPAEVRRALHLKQGDVVQFEIDGDRVTLRRQTREDRAYLKGLEATLSEWSSPYDDEAYGDL
jgi:AbrB family looped-hinge helix DNA binding protein